ncbi:PREDICTED: complexin-1 isoform X2 [Galeopterus variegatus]|uniref:Complexin-1 n=1 Tax=Galeopterus variegatus TaxID=482537 RepID=A0ABM0QGY6_GALVR|nr:PREDICTED: complexin-1 isoform X2 [Galeopterus variegatus]
MGKMLGGDEEKDPDAAKKAEERQEALRQEEEERKAKFARMEAERELVRQGIRDKVPDLSHCHTRPAARLSLSPLRQSESKERHLFHPRFHPFSWKL